MRVIMSLEDSLLANLPKGRADPAKITCMDSINNVNDLLLLIAKLIGLGVLIGIAARIALPGDQRMGPGKTLLYGVAGALIGGGIATLANWSDYAAAGAGALVAILLIGAFHQHGVLIPEDAPPELADVAPAPQGHDLLDVVTRHHDGDAERAQAAAEAQMLEEAHAAVDAAPEGALVVEEHAVTVIDPHVAVDEGRQDGVDTVADPQVAVDEARQNGVDTVADVPAAGDAHHASADEPPADTPAG